MKLRYLALTLPFAAAFAFACSGGDDDALVRGQGANAPVDHPPIDAQRASASPRRLSTDQWRGSFATIFGTDEAGNPLAFHINAKNEALDNAGVARSLGEPDYLGTTDEALDPSLLYAKFADDAARDLCTQALTADAARADAQTRVIVRYAGPSDTVQSNGAAVDANLRYLKLRFHGVYLKSDDAASVATLRTLFDASVTASTGADLPARVVDGWKTVCVALTTAPEFHAY